MRRTEQRTTIPLYAATASTDRYHLHGTISYIPFLQPTVLADWQSSVVALSLGSRDVVAAKFKADKRCVPVAKYAACDAQQ